MRNTSKNTKVGEYSNISKGEITSNKRILKAGKFDKVVGKDKLSELKKDINLG